MIMVDAELTEILMSIKDFKFNTGCCVFWPVSGQARDGVVFRIHEKMPKYIAIHDKSTINEVDY